MNSRLLTIDEMVKLLHRDFSPIESIVSGLRLKKRVEAKENIEQVAQQLGVDFPTDFVDLISAYDFGHFSILSVYFGNDMNYLDQLVDIHRHLSHEDRRQLSTQFVCVAIGDAETLIMDVTNSNIYMFGAERPFNEKIKVAETFPQFICALGTAYVHKKENSEHEFMRLVKNSFGSDSTAFWREVIRSVE